MDTAEFKKLRQSTSDSAIFNNLMTNDAEFKAKVDRVRSGTQLSPFEERMFPKTMLDIQFGVKRSKGMDTTARMLDRGMTRQKTYAQEAIQDPLAFAGKTIANVPRSGMEFMKGVANIVTHPVKTASSLAALSIGGAANTIETIADMAGEKNAEEIFKLESEDMANAVGNFYVQRYGSIEAAAKTFQEDPVGFMSDFSTVVTGIGGLLKGGAMAVGSATGAATRTATQLSKTGRAIRAVENVGGAMMSRGIKMEPIVIAGKGVYMGGRAAVRSVGPTASVERLLVGALKLSRTHVENFQKLTGKTISQFLTEKGILSGGDMAVDTAKGVQFTGRSIFGRTKQGIMDDLERLANKSKSTVDTELAKVMQTYDLLDDAPNVLTAMDEISSFARQFGLTEELDFVNSLIKKERVTLSDINAVKRQMDDLFRMYTKSNDVAASGNALRLRRIRSTLKEFIETEAKDKGLPDIGILNQDTQLSHELLDAAEQASMRGLGLNALSLMDGIFGMGTFSVTNNFFTTAGVVAGRRILGSAPFKTTLAKYVNRLTESQLKALMNVLKTGKHTKDTIAITRKLVRQTAEDLKKNKLGEEESALLKSQQLPLPKALPAKAGIFTEFSTALPEQFKKSIEPWQKKFPDSLSDYSVEDYAKSKSFLSEDGDVGYSITQENEIISVFNKGVKGQGKSAIVHAIENGGDNLMALKPLERYYEQFGFRTVKQADNLISGKDPVVWMKLDHQAHARFKESFTGNVSGRRGDTIIGSVRKEVHEGGFGGDGGGNRAIDGQVKALPRDGATFGERRMIGLDGGQDMAQTLREARGLSSGDIMAKYPDIQLKRGEKLELRKGSTNKP